MTPGRLPTLLCLICLTVFISTELSDGMSHKIRLKPFYIVAKMNLSSWYSWRGSEHLCDRSAFEWEMSRIWACFCLLTSISLPPYFLHSSTHQKRYRLENMRTARQSQLIIFIPTCNCASLLLCAAFECQRCKKETLVRLCRHHFTLFHKGFDFMLHPRAPTFTHTHTLCLVHTKLAVWDHWS